MRNFFHLLLGATATLPLQEMDSFYSSSADVQDMYTQPNFTPPPPPTSLESNYPAIWGPRVRRLLRNDLAPGTKSDADEDEVVEYGLDEEVLEDENDLDMYEDETDLDAYESDLLNAVPTRRLLANDDSLPYMPSGFSDEPKKVKDLKNSADKQVYSTTHRGTAFSQVGCAYLGRACTAFYYPYSTYLKDDKTVDSSKVTIYNGYRQPFGVTGDTTDYQWNVMSSLPYIAKSLLFGKSKHGKAFDDVTVSPQILAGKVVKVTMYGTTRVTSIHVEYKGGHSVWHGKQWKGEELETIVLDEDEDIVEGKFSNCRVRYSRVRTYLHTRLCGATLLTTKGKKVSRGRFGKTVYSTVLPNGFVFAGFFGRKGKNIDQIGLVGIKTDAVQAARKSYPVPQLNAAVWRQTQFPGLVSSWLHGGQWGKRFNLAYTLPSNILQMKLNKLLVYGRGQFTGFTFGYEDGSEIDIGGTKDKQPAIINLGNTGRITRITITDYRVSRVVDPKAEDTQYEKRLRTGGAIIDYIDKDGMKQSVSRGQVNLKKFAHKILDIPTGMEVVAALGGQGTVLDMIGFVLRPSNQIENASPPSALPPRAP